MRVSGCLVTLSPRAKSITPSLARHPPARGLREYIIGKQFLVSFELHRNVVRDATFGSEARLGSAVRSCVVTWQ